MIGLIGAMDEEIAIIKAKLTDVTFKSYANVAFYQGNLKNKAVVLMKSGIGKVNAAVSTTILFEQYNIDYVINIGTAGGVKKGCEVQDIVLSTEVAYHDVDVTAFDYAYGQVPQMPLYFNSDRVLMEKAEEILKKEKFKYHLGLIVSGDAFINKPHQIDLIKSHFANVLAVEMEACSIAHVCYLYKKPFIILRSLSDIAGIESHISFDVYVNQASLNSSIFVEKLVEIM
ncbi:MAG: 5-methylthioadenosine nucleosidase [Haloplasmataceae bacterium]|jgi:adenosylhomocysteine nucleosidase|nr:5-methylthioadenosine nucleosidase [Haloplasmataceae bacterium]